MPATLPRCDLARPSLDAIQAEGMTALLAEVLPRHRFYAQVR